MTKAVTQHTATARRSGTRFKFISETISELKKVVWLSRREAIYLTALVLVIAGAIGVVLSLLDLGFTHLIDGVFLGR
ncbi:preprotein translocase subunit SecE [Chloroflexota bacterium]